MKAASLPAITAAIALGAAPPAATHRVLFSRLGPVQTGLFIASSDGGERPVGPADGLAYSPALSSDGKWIVFTSELDGVADIYRVHPDGKGLERLTNDAAYDDQAAIAPTGNTIAFVSTRGSGRAHVWLLDVASRALRQLTDGSGGDFRPSWSPDGAWVAFSSDRDSHPGDVPGRWEHLQSTSIYIVRRDGTGLKRLTPSGGFAGSPKWSPDGGRLVFYDTTPLGTWFAQRGDPVKGRTQIVSIDVESGARLEHTSGDGVRLSPQFLADGRIGYVSVDSSAKDLPGTAIASNQSTLEIIDSAGRITKGPSGLVRGPSWSVDGREVVYYKVTVPSRPHQWRRTSSRLSDFELTITEPFASFSRGGDKLAYSATYDGTNVADTAIHVMNADGTDRQQVFARRGFSAFSPAWSPAGDRLAFSVGRYFRAAGHPTAQVAIMRADGSDVRFIANDDSNNGFPSWSADGTRIVYKKDQHLVIYSVERGTLTDLTRPGPQYDNFPQWSPKGDRIAFTSNRDGDFEIYAVRPDGSDLRRLTYAPGNDGHPIWSPDGEWLLFSSARMGFKDERPLSERIPQPYGELFVMRAADGRLVRQLTDNQWEDAIAGWQPERTTHRTPSSSR